MKEINWRDALPSVGESDEDAPVSNVIARDTDVLVVAMTEEEVLASTSSRGKKMVRVEPPSYATPMQFKSVMAAAYQLYMHSNGRLANPKDVAGFFGKTLSETLTASKIEKIMESPQFRRAMLIRGIDFSSTSRISVEQDMAMAIMASPDGMPFLKKLMKAGVAPSKWRAWLKQKHFREAWNALGASALTDYEGDMLTALVGQALQGETQAIKFALEVSGRHAPARSQQVDSELILARLIEIVQEEVKDIAVLQRIAVRMQMVASTPSGKVVINAAANAVSSSPRPTLAEQTLHEIEATELAQEVLDAEVLDAEVLNAEVLEKKEAE